MRYAALALLLPLMTHVMQAANFTARKTLVDGVEVVQLGDAARHMEVSIAPSIGNMAYEILVGGKNVLWFPFHSPADFKQNPTFAGVPFLAPWANRLDGDFFWANGKKYLLNLDLGNVRRDNHQKPIHGLLNFSSAWELVTVTADDRSASVTSRLEFWRHPEMMAQFPFAHTITMTYRLANGEVEVETVLDNHSTDPMPVAVGYHPYFRLYDAPRDRWKVHLAARDHLVLNDQLIPTGERKPVEFADPYPLERSQLDDVFAGLVRGADGRAVFRVEGARERVSVVYGPKYTVAVVYAPPGREFICFEPMAAITDGFNLAHSGAYTELQSVRPGGQWKESFWIRPSAF
jgi:aldose 1-epimerase